jgi:hypothetical protein
MKFRIVLAVLAFGASAFGMSQKPKVSLRFHPEVNPNDGGSFAMPVKLHYHRREAHLSRVPAVSEREIKAIYPFAADDGTWGCHFQFNDQGRLRLETMSSQQMNTALVLFVATKMGQHQVIDMLIDRPVTNGALTVPRGLTAAEVVVMKEQFPVLGEVKGKGKKKQEAPPKKDDVTDWRMARPTDSKRGDYSGIPTPIATAAPRGVTARPTQPPAQPGAPTVPRNTLRELDLPRVQD